MKNFSKNNYSKTSNVTENRRSQSKNNFKKGNDLSTRDNLKGETIQIGETILIEEIILKG